MNGIEAGYLLLFAVKNRSGNFNAFAVFANSIKPNQSRLPVNQTAPFGHKVNADILRAA